jgi:hypothetical protein
MARAVPGPQLTTRRHNRWSDSNLAGLVYVTSREETRETSVNRPASNGTRADSPQAAGIVALMKQIKPSITPNEVIQVLRLTGAYGSDPEVGSMARPLGALQYLGARP